MLPYRGLRTLRYTYVRNTRGPWLLYDNEVDPYQTHNLCGHVAYAGIQAELEAELRRRLDQMGDEFLPGEAYLERDGLAHYEEVNVAWGSVPTMWGLESLSH